MEKLKEALIIALALSTIDYDSVAGEIVLSVDASRDCWGAILQQEQPGSGKWHPVRYESGVWTTLEKNYDAGK